jgi:hypothetical protein
MLNATPKSNLAQPQPRSLNTKKLTQKIWTHHLSWSNCQEKTMTLVLTIEIT